MGLEITCEYVFLGYLSMQIIGIQYFVVSVHCGEIYDQLDNTAEPVVSENERNRALFTEAHQPARPI